MTESRTQVMLISESGTIYVTTMTHDDFQHYIQKGERVMILNEFWKTAKGTQPLEPAKPTTLEYLTALGVVHELHYKLREDKKAKKHPKDVKFEDVIHCITEHIKGRMYNIARPQIEAVVLDILEECDIAAVATLGSVIKYLETSVWDRGTVSQRTFDWFHRSLWDIIQEISEEPTP